MIEAIKEYKGWAIGAAATAVIIIVATVWYVFFTASGQDFRTDLVSDVSGIEREIVVYTQFGDELERYSGENVRMDYSADGRVQIQLDGGDRVQISNGIVIVEEPNRSEEDESYEEYIRCERRTNKRCLRRASTQGLVRSVCDCIERRVGR